MRILILGTNYAPEMTGISPFTTGLAEHLVEDGHAVTVATCFPHFPGWKVWPEYRGRLGMTEQREGVEVRRQTVFIPARRSRSGRVLYDSSFALGAAISGLRGPRPDVIISISPPVQAGLAGGLLKRRWGASHVVLVKDLPIDAALSVGMMAPGRAVEAGRRLERLAYRQADRVVVISAGFRRKLVALGVDDGKIVEIPDWADTTVIRPLPPDPKERRFLGAGDSDFLLLHAGNMGEKQGLPMAVAAALSAGDEDAFKLALVGDGFARPELETMVGRDDSRRVTLRPLQPADRVPQLLAAADALLLNQTADVVDSVAPSKLLTYMASGRPVIAAVNAQSEAAHVVLDSGCGIVVRPGDESALVAGVAELRKDAHHRADLGSAGRRFVEERYARESVLKQWDGLLEEVAVGRVGRRPVTRVAVKD